jgi:Phosphotransferase enzyme family
VDSAALAFVAEVTGATGAARSERIQSLWGGYGELVRVRLTGAARASAVVKWARPPARASRAADASHARKCRSYDVETAFYRTFAGRCDDACRVAALLGARRMTDEWLLVLEDLDDAGFARRESDPDGADLDACLAWLAAFHARFVGERPEGLWPVGTYWHLGTRQEELAAVADPALRARAPALDRALREARHRTILHGDAKPANFCFGERGRAVAAVDFQYAGGGPGVRDVAYLLHGCGAGVAKRGVDAYFACLRAALPAQVDGDALEREWRDLYPVASLDFERFLAGWRR